MGLLIHFPCLFLFLFLIISFTLISGSHGVHSKCRDDQKSKLLQLKHGLITFDGSIPTRLALWNTSTDCCSWEGVTCNNGRVIGLDLSSEGIHGGFNSSSSLFDLLFLQSLNLAHNFFYDVEIPHGFDKLANMTYLNLSYSLFSGHIPSGISSLKQLVTLDISSTYFFPSLKLECPSLRTLIQNLSKLEELYLDGVIINADGYEWCQALSTSVPNLRVLSLSGCNLLGPIDSSLARLASLSVIRLNFNELSTIVPKFFSNFTDLTTLSIINSNLHGSFPTEIFLLPKLQIIDMLYNELLEGSFPETFSPDNSLQTVVFRSTNFFGKIPDSIHNLKLLSKLDLSRCNLSGGIPSLMKNLKQLVYLDLSYNMLTGNIPSLHLSKNLSFIDFSNNHLTGQIQSLQWKSFSKLEYLDLSCNSLTGSIPLSLFSLPLLRRIQLSDNQFSGQLNEFQPASSSQLQDLDLSANKLEGSIPISVFELKGLEALRLSHNCFNGTVDPNMIKNLTDITFNNIIDLDISFNKLSLSGNNFIFSILPKLTTLKLESCDLEEFPNLQNQSSLNYLDLSNNKIRGEIPRWLFEIGSLESLNLSYNKLVSFEKPLPYISHSLAYIDLHSNLLQGEIPILISSPYILDYSNNNFSSFMPDENGYYLTNTSFFSLSNNSLTGPIPKSICNALYLEVLNLSFNDLNGTIPPCLLQMGSIRVLDLGRNKLTGTIPDTLPATCSLRTFDINDNQIHGSLPRMLGNCNDLEVLNVGNNQITDTFPLWFGNFSMLRVLVLRSNKFHGPIQCQGSIRNLTMLQIVDLASNNFSGYISNRCFLSWATMMHNVDESKPVANHLNYDDHDVYYQDTVTLTFKGSRMELVKILTIFTTIDLSNNNFEGDIPEMIGELKSLHGLNLSNNAFTKRIPTSLENLTRLESLDLSRNKLIGNIPIGLTRLTFLSFLNISFNNLTGKIPIGSQFNTFRNTSYLGNEGLCGEPLSKHCSTPPPEGTKEDENSNSATDIFSEYVSAEIGFTFGLGIVIWPLVFWKRWRDLFFSFFDGILLKISILQNRRKLDQIRRAR